MAALGSLVVNLGLNFAQYTGGLDKSEQAALAAAKRIQDTFDNMKTRLAATAGALAGGLAAGFTVNAFKGLLSGAIETGAALDDLAMQTGATVEALSGLVAVGKYNNMGPEAIGGAMNKLAANLAGATEESKGTGKALEALGINFDTFKQQRPEEQMQTVAKAMAGYKDSADKGAVAMALFGKQGAQMLPFLKDLAEVEELAAKITKSGEAWGKELAQGMIPALDQGAQAFLDVMNGSGGLRDEVRRLVADGSVERWTKGAITGLTYVGDAAQYLWRGVKFLAESLGAYAAAGVASFGSVGSAIAKALTGDFAGALSTLNSGVIQSKAIIADLGATGIASFSEDTFGAKIRARMSDIGSVGEKAEEAKPKLDFTNVLAKNEKAAKEAKNPLDALLESIDKRIAVGREELAMGEKLTEGEKLAAEVNLKVKNSKDAQIIAGKAVIETRLQEMLITEKSVAVHRHELQTLEDLRKERAKQVQAMEQSVDQLMVGNQSLRDEIELIGQTEGQQLRILQRRNEITIATKKATLAEMERRSAVTGTQTREEIALKQEIELLEERNDLMEGKYDRTQTAQATQKFNDQIARDNEDLRRGLGDAIEAAVTQGGKAGGKKLRDVLQEALRKPLRVLLDGAINSLFGLNGGGLSGGASGGLGGIQNLVSMASTAYSGATKAWGFVSNFFNPATTSTVGSVASTGINAVADGVLSGSLPGVTQVATGATTATGASAASSAAPAWVAAGLKALPIIGWIVAGMQASGAAYDQGYRLQDETIKKTYGLIFPHLNKLTDAFVKMGMSERTANVITGGALVAKVASKLGIQSTLHSGAGAIVQNGQAQEGRELYTLANFGMGDPREYNKDVQGVVTGIANNIADTLDVFFESFGIAAGVKVGTAFADDLSKDGAWGSLRIESAAGKSLVDWETTRKSKWAPREFANGEEGYKQYLNEISRGTVDALKGAASELPAWANRIIAAADTSGDKVDEVLQKVLADVAAFPNALLQAAGTSRDELVTLYADGLKSGDAKAAGMAVADTLVAALENTFYTQAAGKVFDIINMGIVTPMVDALLTGAALSDVMSQATMDAVIQRATATATALNAVFNDPQFAALLESIRTSLGGALGTAGSGLTYQMRYQATTADTAAEATGNMADAADELTKKYESAIASLTSAKDSMAVELLRVQGKEKEAKQLERDQYMAQFAGLDDVRRREIETLYDANIATRAYIDGLKAASTAQRDRLAALRESTDSELANASSALDRAMADYERLAAIEKTKLNETITAVRSVFDAASNGAKALFGEVDAVVKFQGRQGQDFITQALTRAKATGQLPDGKELAEAITGANAGLSREVFASQAEADYARLVMANELKDLSDISGDQLTEAEAQLKKLDENIQIGHEQINELRGINGGVKTMAEALAAVLAAYGQEAQTRQQINSQVIRGDGQAIFDKKTGTGLTGNGTYFNAADIAAEAAAAIAANPGVGTSNQIYNILDAGGYTMAQYNEMFGMPPGTLEAEAKALGRPIFHKGTNYVPRTGFALLEKGEAVIPTASNPFAPGRGGLGGDTSVLEALLRRLTGQMDVLQGSVVAGSAASKATADLLESVRNGNGLIFTPAPVF